MSARLCEDRRPSFDGEVVLEESYTPQGLRDEGSSFGQASLWLEPGQYQLEIWLNDNGVEWRSVFNDLLVIDRGRTVSLIYLEREDAFRRDE